MLLLKKESQILKRHLGLKNKKIYTNSKDRFSISLIGCLSRRTINNLSIVKPKTLLNWQRKLICKRWTHKYKRKGRPQPVGTWKTFLKAHWNSLFGMDFMTADTLFGESFYLLIILELKSRKIVKWDITEYPVREFVRQRIIDFSYDYPEEKYLIHDNAAQFTTIDFKQYDIHSVNTSIAAPNMNAHVF
jgi:transposase InsO family protein